MAIHLLFTHLVSDAYKLKLQTFLDDVAAQGLTANRPPQIFFQGMNGETFFILERLRRDYDLA